VLEALMGRGRRSAGGFTLMELMIAVVIIAILLGMAVPSFRDVILNTRRSSATNELLASLQMARGEALKLARSVTVCPSTEAANPSVASPVCASATDAWSTGWLVYVNNDNAYALPEPDAGEAVLQRGVNSGEGITIKADVTNVSYRPFQAAMATGLITVCDPRATSDATQARAIILGNTGRPRVDKVDAANNALVCP
jgi:type IV fimbrial biogenesis protein FimT